MTNKEKAIVVLSAWHEGQALFSEKRIKQMLKFFVHGSHPMDGLDIKIPLFVDRSAHILCTLDLVDIDKKYLIEQGIALAILFAKQQEQLLYTYSIEYDEHQHITPLVAAQLNELCKRTQLIDDVATGIVKL